VTSAVATITGAPEAMLSYQLLFESNPNPMWVLDEGTGRFLEVNAAAVATYGYTRSEFLEMAIDDIRPASAVPWLELIRVQHPVEFRPRAVSQHLLKGGAIIDVEVSSISTTFERTSSRLVVSVDISARVETERALRESEARHRELIENAHDLIATVDLEQRLTSVNTAFERALGFSRDELIGMPLAVFVPEAWHDRLADAHQAKASQDVPETTYEHEFLAKDGRRIAVEVSTSLILSNGVAVGTQAVCRDISERKASERLLRDNEALFRTAFEDAANGMLLLSPVGDIQRANARAVELFGYSIGELCDLRLLSLTHPDDMERSCDVLSRIRTGELESFNTEKRYVRKDGAAVWMEVAAAPVRDVAGTVVNFVVQLQDVTARREVEDALRESEARFRTLFETSPSGMDIVDRDGRIVLTNAALEDLLGYDKEELASMQFPELTHPDDRGDDARFNAEMLDGLRSSYEREKRYIRKDGGEVWVHLTVFALPDPSGRRQLSIGTREDITERKRNEEALARSEAQARAMLDTALDAIVTIDGEGLILEFNRAAERMFGRARADAMGERINTLLPEGDNPHFARYLQTRDPADLGRRELTVLRSDGTEFPAELALSVMDAGDGPVFTGFLRDLSEQQALQAQLIQSQKVEAVGQLAGGIAHDFNNLLTAISSYADLAEGALDATSDSRLAESVSGIRGASDQAARLTQQLLAFSRRQVLKPEILCANDVVEEHVPMLRRLLGEEIDVRLSLAPSLAASEIDPGLLSQVLMNLAVNARDAMPAGGVLTIATENVDLRGAQTIGGPGNGPHVMLSVTDTGDGIDDATLERVFEPFFTTKDHGKGTGLGLPTVIGIVEQSGGRVAVQTEAGVGTTFTVYLPLVDDAVTFRETPEAPPVARPPGHERILLVEDNEIVRGPVTLLLEELGYDVVPAEGPTEALELAADGAPIDLLLTDVVMPGMNGRQLAERLRELRPELKVLFMSGYTDDAVIARGVIDHEMAFLQKPFGADHLARAVSELFGR
jgi:two-component system, cell cycle sensor histidine kinase and response regulator CckA